MASGLSGKGTNRRRNRLPRLPIISAVLVFISLFLFIGELIAFSQQEDRLPQDLVSGSVPIGGMLPREAITAWDRAYAAPVVLYYDDSPILLDPATIGFRVNQQTMLAEALSVSEAEGSFWIRFFNHLTRQEFDQPVSLPLHADYQRGLLEQFLRDISQRYDRPIGSAGYDMLTLTTFAGSGGFVLDVDAAMNMIDRALRRPDHRVVNLPTTGRDSGRPGIETLRDLIISYLDSQSFIYDGLTTVASVYIMDLTTGEEINLLGDVAFTAASTTKVPILIEYFRRLSTEPTLDEAWLMANSLLCSRNASSNLLMQIIGGGQDIFAGLVRVTQTAQHVGARNTFIAAPFVEGVAGQQLGSVAVPPTSPNRVFNTNPDPYNQTTAEDMGILFTMLYDCARYGSGLMAAFPNGEFNQTECQRMLNLMSANDLERLLQGGIPEGVHISHKNGWLADTVGNAGIVFPPNGHDYVISVFLWEEAEFQDFNRLWPLVEGISRAAWNYFSPEDPMLLPRELPPTAQDCEGNYLPPNASLVNLDDINAWRRP